MSTAPKSVRNKLNNTLSRDLSIPSLDPNSTNRLILPVSDESDSFAEGSYQKEQKQAAEFKANLEQDILELRDLDQETTQVINAGSVINNTAITPVFAQRFQQCCSLEQTTQFWYYAISRSCTSRCEIEDTPKSGGWYQTTFAMLCYRTLLEVQQKIKANKTSLGALSKAEALNLVNSELRIAQGTFQSAVQRENLDQQWSLRESARVEYGQFVSSIERDKQRLDSLRGLTPTLITQLQQAEQTSIVKRNRFDITTERYNWLLNFKADQSEIIHHRALRVQAERELWDSEDALHICRDKYHRQKNEIVLLENSQQENILAANKRVSEYESAHNALKTLIEEYSTSMFASIHGLKIGQSVCHARGFIGHAIYFNFQNLGPVTQLKIGNLGAGSEYHDAAQSGVSTPLRYPYVIEFTNDSAGHHFLKKYCRLVTQAVTETPDKAVVSIYQSGCGKVLTEKAYKNRYASTLSTLNQGLTAEIVQKIGNCTVKGYLHCLRERIGSEQYKNLMLSLLVWSKNTDNVRSYLNGRNSQNHVIFFAPQARDFFPESTSTFLTSQDLTDLKASESVFSGERDLSIKILMQENFSGLRLVPSPEAEPSLRDTLSDSVWDTETSWDTTTTTDSNRASFSASSSRLDHELSANLDFVLSLYTPASPRSGSRSVALSRQLDSAGGRSSSGNRSSNSEELIFSAGMSLPREREQRTARDKAQRFGFRA